MSDLPTARTNANGKAHRNEKAQAAEEARIRREWEERAAERDAESVDRMAAARFEVQQGAGCRTGAQVGARIKALHADGLAPCQIAKVVGSTPQAVGVYLRFTGDVPHAKAQKRTSRRSVSLSGATYRRLQAWCVANGTAVSAAIERMIAERLGREDG